jgi:hypothetical protein
MSELVHLVEQVLIVGQIVMNFFDGNIFTQLDIGPQAVDVSSHQINLPLFLLDHQLVSIVSRILQR